MLVFPRLPDNSRPYSYLSQAAIDFSIKDLRKMNYWALLSAEKRRSVDPEIGHLNVCLLFLLLLVLRVTWEVKLKMKIIFPFWTISASKPLRGVASGGLSGGSSRRYLIHYLKITPG